MSWVLAECVVHSRWSSTVLLLLLNNQLPGKINLPFDLQRRIWDSEKATELPKVTRSLRQSWDFELSEFCWRQKLYFPKRWVLSFKKANKRCTMLELCVKFFVCFFWGGGCGKMRTAALERASQIGLRNFSKEVVGEWEYMWFWWRESSCNQALILQKVLC